MTTTFRGHGRGPKDGLPAPAAIHALYHLKSLFLLAGIRPGAKANPAAPRSSKHSVPRAASGNRDPSGPGYVAKRARRTTEQEENRWPRQPARPTRMAARRSRLPGQATDRGKYIAHDTTIRPRLAVNKNHGDSSALCDRRPITTAAKIAGSMTVRLASKNAVVTLTRPKIIYDSGSGGKMGRHNSSSGFTRHNEEFLSAFQRLADCIAICVGHLLTSFIYQDPWRTR